MGHYKILLLFGAFVLLNNSAWYFYTDTQTTVSSAETAQELTKTPATNNTQPALKNPSQPNLTITNTPALKPVLAQAAPQALEMEANLPLSESQELLGDQAFSKETFTFDSQEHKLATIEQLVPQGEDLIFLQKIIESAESEPIKIAAIERLNGQPHFGVLNTAIKVLEKNNSTLGTAALGVLKNSRDISLIPQLRSQALNVKNTELKQEIDATIVFLEKSVSMGMDSEGQ
ncbi:MAG: hypothetical protein RL497_2157 [Pseudomonadota bacterium]